MGTLAKDVLTALIDWALALGPMGSWVLPSLGVLGGIALIGGGHAAWQQRLRRRAHDLAASARRRIPREEEGRRVVLVGRLRVAGSETVRSYVDGRPVAVSSLLRIEGPVTTVSGTRRATGLAVETEDGLVPIHGTIHVERTRAPLRLAGTPDSARAALDVAAGELVMVEGMLGRVAQEGLREQGAVLGVSSETQDFGQLPIRMTALRLELPRALPRVALAGALAGVLLLTPWPVAVPEALVIEPDLSAHPNAMVASRRAVLLFRLLGPTRSTAVTQLAAATALPEPAPRPQPTVAGWDRL